MSSGATDPGSTSRDEGDDITDLTVGHELDLLRAARLPPTELACTLLEYITLQSCTLTRHVRLFGNLILKCRNIYMSTNDFLRGLAQQPPETISWLDVMRVIEEIPVLERLLQQLKSHLDDMKNWTFVDNLPPPDDPSTGIAYIETWVKERERCCSSWSSSADIYQPSPSASEPEPVDSTSFKDDRVIFKALSDHILLSSSRGVLADASPSGVQAKADRLLLDFSERVATPEREARTVIKVLMLFYIPCERWRSNDAEVQLWKKYMVMKQVWQKMDQLLATTIQYAKDPTNARLNAVEANWNNTAITLRGFEELVKIAPADPELLELGKGVARVPFPSYNSFVHIVMMLRRLHERLSEPEFSTDLDQRRDVKDATRHCISCASNAERRETVDFETLLGKLHECYTRLGIESEWADAKRGYDETVMLAASVAIQMQERGISLGSSE